MAKETKETEPAKKRMPDELRAAAACGRILDKVPAWAAVWAVNYLTAKYLNSPAKSNGECRAAGYTPRPELVPSAKGDLPF